MIYNWQKTDWPEFSYETATIAEILIEFAKETELINGLMKGLTLESQTEAIISLMVSEAIKTSEIEGEYLSRQDVVSSIRNNLGLNLQPDKIKDKKARGIGELMVDVRRTYQERLTKSKLFSWHKMVMDGTRDVKAGNWRTHEEPMQVISGAAGKEKVHFEAPPSSKVPGEMERFIDWYNDTAPGGKKEIKSAQVRSAVAHIYFESIHPFEDGNGRVGRAIAEKALSQTIGHPLLLSLSKTIEANKRIYYDALALASRSNEITKWVAYFAGTILDAQKQARQLVHFSLIKAKFFDLYKDKMNDRQMKVVKRMFDAGPDGFKGGMTSGKYVSLTQTSKATATRDLQHLADIKVFTCQGGGRNIHYLLNLDEM